MKAELIEIFQCGILEQSTTNFQSRSDDSPFPVLAWSAFDKSPRAVPAWVPIWSVHCATPVSERGGFFFSLSAVCCARLHHHGVREANQTNEIKAAGTINDHVCNPLILVSACLCFYFYIFVLFFRSSDSNWFSFGRVVLMSVSWAGGLIPIRHFSPAKRRGGKRMMEVEWNSSQAHRVSLSVFT